MTTATTIEQASPDDADAIAAIYGHYVAESTATFELEAPGGTEVRERMAKVSAGGYPWLVARDGDGSVMGYAYATRFHPREGYRYSCETSIYVAQEHLRKGIGGLLIEALVAACEKAGFRQAFAVIAGTEPASVVLHARAGFRPCGTLEKSGRKHGQWIDVFIMQRVLGEGGETSPPDEP